MTEPGAGNIIPSSITKATSPLQPTSTTCTNPITTTSALKTPTTGWNTKNLGQRICADAASAATAGILVAPIITAIDKAIIENASGRQSLGISLRASLTQFAFRPHTFVFSKPFALIFSLYAGTYLTANALDTASSTVTATKASTTTSGPAKFVATSTANLSLCLYKDSRFARFYGAAASSPRSVPLPTYALFAVRDCLTVFASFNLPPVIAPMLPLTENMKKYVTEVSAAQFLAPAAIQLISTPLHLLGLDLYNREGTVGWQGRMKRVTRDWGMSSVARMARIVPAFGVGGVVNMRVRGWMMRGLE